MAKKKVELVEEINEEILNEESTIQEEPIVEEQEVSYLKRNLKVKEPSFVIGKVVEN